MEEPDRAADALRGLDYLAARPEVDAARLGTLGLSMGSTMAWWLAALDERVRVNLRGGYLQIEWQGEGHPLLMSGPATTVFEGQIAL